MKIHWYTLSLNIIIIVLEEQRNSRNLGSELELPTSKREPSSSSLADFAPKSMAETHIEQARTQSMLTQTGLTIPTKIYYKGRLFKYSV